ncbi:tetratricopeptide repeat protein [Actinosynnema pretiosum subsp. pretiosum]|uniref:Tetratricopeptide repeat protein n=1 Tax=Actinosynnema pretiosum subsp. pretiosum TaxID=103721 RepID=A0AA45L6W1_9PSEU|nr:transcriptional regulator, SARP family [Actinosynnema pretiosum subsp. pretiosum]QUF04436.1 tetratricopeptide repeat protein [Actinosynnema pretiosum subsp. pretiosum]
MKDIRNVVSGAAHVVVQAGNIEFGLPAPRPPMQLPGWQGALFNQRQAQAALSGALPEGGAGLLCVSGQPGVGKSALVVHWARRNLAHFPDGVLYADLRGHNPATTPAEPGEVLDPFLHALGVPGLGGVEDRAAQYRSALSGKRVLVVLDDATSAEQVRPLLPGGRSVVVVTSRSRLRGLVVRDGAVDVPLGPLSLAEAVALIVERSDGVGVADDPATEVLARRCGCLPLLLLIAAQRIDGFTFSTAAELAGELAEKAVFAVLRDDGDVVGVSYRRLAPEQARVFRLLGLLPGATATPEAVVALTGLPLGAVREALGALCLANLLEVVVAGQRFQLVSPLREYAAERADEEEDAQERFEAVSRVLGWHLASALAADRALGAARTGVIFSGSGRPFADAGEAGRWLASERVNLVACARRAAELGEHGVAWRLAVALFEHCYRVKAWDDWITVHEIGLASARASGEAVAVALVLGGLGVAFRERREHGRAEECFREALEIHEGVRDERGIGWVAIRYAQLCRELGRGGEAVALASRALDVAEHGGDRQRAGEARNSLSGLHREAGRTAEALARAQEALVDFTAAGSARSVAWARLSAANALRDAGRFAEAMELYALVREARRAPGEEYGLALVLAELGYARCLSGDVAVGLAELREGLALLPEADAVRERVLGWIERFTAPDEADPTGDRPGP